MRGAERTRGPTRWALLVRCCSMKQNRLGCPLLQAHAALPSEQRFASEEAHVSLDSAWLLSAVHKKTFQLKWKASQIVFCERCKQAERGLAGFLGRKIRTGKKLHWGSTCPRSFHMSGMYLSTSHDLIFPGQYTPLLAGKQALILKFSWNAQHQKLNITVTVNY